MECPRTPPGYAHVAFESYPRKNGGWGTLAGVMATIALSSRYGSKLAYDTGIWGESYRLFAAKFLFGLRYRWCLGIGRVVSRQALWLIWGWLLLMIGWMWWSRMSHGWLFLQGKILQCCHYFALTWDISDFYILLLICPFNVCFWSKWPTKTASELASRTINNIIMKFYFGELSLWCSLTDLNFSCFMKNELCYNFDIFNFPTFLFIRILICWLVSLCYG